MNAMVTMLQLVYPPVSNQEAEWVKTDPAVEALVRSSDFYLIGARASMTFDDPRHDGQGRVTVRISTGGGLRDEVVLDPAVLATEALRAAPESIVFDFGPKIMKFYAGTTDEVEAGTADLFEWFTTEKLIYDRGREIAGIDGFDKFRDFGTYELLYVGIAKSTDTFERLFEGAHHARQKILSNEWPRRQGARVTDEIVLFPLRIEPIVFRSLSEGDVPTTVTSAEWQEFRKKIVIDAEKAFVHLLDPQYNVEKFARYPRSKDGLWGHGYQRYGFVLSDNLTFTTTDSTFRGSRNATLGIHDNYADMIVTIGDKVELFVGLDRPQNDL
jgi:hypothetical protein